MYFYKIDEYHGWKNKPTWLLYTWLSDDSECYYEIQELARELSERENPVDQLIEVLKHRTEGIVPEQGGLDSDLILWASSFIDYRAVAKAFLVEALTTE